LTWFDQNCVINNSGGTYVAKRYRPTGPYDIDPTIGGSYVPGFTEWSAFYKLYRVLSVKARLDLVNFDSGTVLKVVFLPLNLDPGATPSLQDIVSWALQPRARTTMLSKSGGMDRSSLALSFQCRDVVGTDSFFYDDSYGANVTTVPDNNVYVAIGAFVVGGIGSFTQGLGTSLTLTMQVEFYERNSLLS
jgi:hypothetical protein